VNSQNFYCTANNGPCYMFSKSTLLPAVTATWANARTYCQALGGNLATFDSLQQQLEVELYFSGQGQLSRVGSVGAYYWWAASPSWRRLAAPNLLARAPASLLRPAHGCGPCAQVTERCSARRGATAGGSATRAS
jgi:hypothetical protein